MSGICLKDHKTVIREVARAQKRLDTSLKYICNQKGTKFPFKYGNEDTGIVSLLGGKLEE